MADRYVRATGGNWNSAATWELTPGGGESVAIPTTADDCYCVIGSGQLTITTGSSCKSLDQTGYANTTTQNYLLTIAGVNSSGNSLVLNGTYNCGADEGGFTFSSSEAGVHKIDLNNKTVGNLLFSGSAEYQMQNDWTFRSTAVILTQTAGTLDINGKTITGGNIYTTGTTPRTLTFGNARLNLNGTSYTFYYTGGNLTVTANTAIVNFTGVFPYFYASGLTTDWNGLSLVINSSSTCRIYGNNTFKDLVIDASSFGRTIQIESGTTQIITGNFYVFGNNTKLINIQTLITGISAVISKTSGMVNLYGCTMRDIVATGGANFFAPSNADLGNNSGINFTPLNNEILYADYELGNDSTTDTPYGWWSVDYTGAAGTAPVIDETATGASSGSTAKICGRVNLYDWSNGSGTLYFYGKSNAFQAETVNLSGGGSFSIAGDFTYCAWKTINLGATAARISPGTTIRYSKSSAPISIGNATWTSTTRIGGGFPSALNITGTADNGSGLIRLTMTDTSTLTTGNICQVLAVTGTVEANGVWPITVIDSTHIDLEGSTYTNAWISGGTCQNITSKAVVFTSALTKNIDNCDIAWSAVNGSTVSLEIYSTTIGCKEGQASNKIVKSSPANNTRYAYRAIANTDYSSYQKITFWIRVASTVLNNQWNLCLCSDTLGTTIVDTFPIPAIPTTGGTVLLSWACLTIERNGGGNLGNSIQSVALYSGSSAGSTTGIYLDNMQACTTNGLSLQSLISKNSLDQGGDEGWYGIQSIDPTGKIILLDNDTNSRSNTGRGYSTVGTSPETVTTYKRETTKRSTLSATVDSSNVILGSMNKSGTIANLIAYEAGFDPATNLQNGVTFIDGINGCGYGMYNNSYNYCSFNWFSFTRCYTGSAITANMYYFKVYNVQDANNCSTHGFYWSYGYGRVGDISITRIGNTNNNGSAGVNLFSGYWNIAISTIINANNNNASAVLGYANSGSNFHFGTIVNVLNNGSAGVSSINNSKFDTIINTMYNGYGINFYGNGNNIVREITNCKYNNYGLYLIGTYNNVIQNLTTDGNTYAIFHDYGNIDYIRNWNAIGTTTIGGETSFSNSRLYSWNHNLIQGNHKIWTDGGTINSTTEAGKRYTETGIAWQFSPLAARNSTYPLNEKLAEIPVNAGILTTIKCWVLKDHATDIAAALVIKGKYLSGVESDVITNKTDDTNWEQLTVACTPLEKGILIIEGWAWYVSGNSNVYFDDLTVS